MKKFIIVFIAFLCGIAVDAQNKITVQSTYYTVDSAYDVSFEKQSKALIEKYKPIVNERMSEKIGESAQKMTASMPESLLTNLACDIILKKGNEILNEPADLSLLNVGGFRAELPEGDVSLGDIYTIFSFNNTIRIAFIKGKYLRQLFTMFAEEQMQPMSNVVLTIQNNQLKETLIGGKPLEDEKIYKLVTIDYLILGGDKMEALTKAERYIITPFLLRNVITEYFIEQYQHGLQVNSAIDGRVIIIE